MRLVQDFSEGRADQRDLLGGKGANLAEMMRLGIPVPPGFTVTTDACRSYLAAGGVPPSGLPREIDEAVERLENVIGRRFGAPDDPLLVSVRSGAKFSMPGMMDTVLNVGLNAITVKGLAAATGDDRFAADSWRRLTEMYASVVLGVDGRALAAVRDALLAQEGVDDASQLRAAGALALVQAYRNLVERETGEPFPDDPREQLHRAVEAVFASWNGRRARTYRELEGIDHDLGTAVNVQAMVYGNLGSDSGTGVVFTRDPATGTPAPYGDWLLGAQGEDVVAGVRNTEPIAALDEVFPQAAAELRDVLARLEHRFREMCDVEFTVERSRLWVLQTRVGKRSAQAALRIAVDMVTEGLIDAERAVMRVTPAQLEQLLHPRFDPDAPRAVVATGLGASPGAATGEVVFTADAAQALAEQGRDVLLVRPETSPEDLHGIVAARGVLTSRGGLVSHAAVVARGIGTPAVCGADALEIDVDADRMTIGELTVRAGDVVSIDGTTGEVVLGAVPVLVPEPTPELETLLTWADGVRRLGVRANADTAQDARHARELGAEGIGLCRTEHMFLGERLPVLQDVILAESEADRQRSLAVLHDVQRADFEALLAEMDGLPVTVRLLDPPLHEFLPDVHELELRRVTQGSLSSGEEAMLAAARSWQEHNPMLGVRGVRLSVLRPELYAMQVRALVEAAVARRAAGGDPWVQVMIPLVATSAELAHALEEVRRVAAETAGDSGLDVHVGTMIETPRAALIADELARACDFCSFGTNDLTQLTFGFSRDDVEARMMPRYLSLGLLPHDPFATVDTTGVGQLVAVAVETGREADASVEFGVCGEHGGDPDSIAFFERAGLDYVSCSPYRLPVARLAAAHAALAGR